MIVEEAHPDLREAHECFQVLRALDYAISKAALLRDHRNKLKPEVIWNIEKGLKLQRRRSGTRRGAAPGAMPADARFFRAIRPAADAGDHRRRVPDRAALSRGMRRQKIRQLRGMAGDRLRHYAGLLSGAVAARAASPRRNCRSACKSSARRAPKDACSPARSCWRISWACVIGADRAAGRGARCHLSRARRVASAP